MTTPYAVIDAQVHVSAPHGARFPWTTRALEQLSPQAHEKFGDPASSADHLVSLMDEAGVDHAILASRGVIYGTNCEYAFDAADRHTGRFGVVGAFYPNMPDGPEKAEVFLERTYATGIRMVLPAPGAERITDANCRGILAAAERGRIPFFAHLTHHPGRIADLLAVAREFPDLAIVIDHLGLNTLEAPHLTADLETLERLSDHGNIAIKWSGVATLSRQPFPFDDLWFALDRLLEVFGPDRLMWGSDITGNFERMTYRQAVDHVRESERLSREDKAMILGGTARAILGWPGTSANRHAAKIHSAQGAQA